MQANMASPILQFTQLLCHQLFGLPLFAYIFLLDEDLRAEKMHLEKGQV
jgi:hypothetical protein